MPTTRSGRTYSIETRESEQQNEMGTENENIAALVKMIMEDRDGMKRIRGEKQL